MSFEKDSEIHVLPAGETTPNQIVCHNKWMVSWRGQFAMELMKATMVSDRTDTPNVVVVHCCDIADKAVAEFERRGWTTPAPTWDALCADGPGKPGFVDHG